MKTAAVTKLKASLSEILLSVKAGEEVCVTERGKPIARIVPIKRDESILPVHLVALERAGLTKIGSGKIPKKFWDIIRPVDKKGKGLNVLLEERREGR